MSFLLRWAFEDTVRLSQRVSFQFGSVMVGSDTCDEVHCLKTNGSLRTINGFDGHVRERCCIYFPLNEVELSGLPV